MEEPKLPPLPPNFAHALELIDAAHAEDPNKTSGDASVPYELHYARKMTRWLAAHTPDASPALQLACRAQHFRRWELPRDSFPMTRPGYLLWRAKCKTRAAGQVSALLSDSESVAPPIAAADVERVSALIAKQGLAQGDAETQALEDVACLVFLDDQLDGFEARDDVDEEKMVGILRKTWAKMGERGRELALGMELSERAKALVGTALES